MLISHRVDSRDKALGGKVINISVVSSDRAIADSCRSILSELIPGRFAIDQSETAGRADVYLWDPESVPTLPSAMAVVDGSLKLIIVSKRLQASVRSTLPHHEFSYLHSPWTKLSLRIFLESAISRIEFGSQNGGSAERLGLDRDKILQKLLETNAKLQEYDRDRTNFLTRAVHDIRVPLMAVNGYCGLLLAGQLGPINAEQARILDRMQASLTRLGGLAESMMELGVSGDLSTKINLQNAMVEPCVNQAVHEILHLAEQKQIALNLDLEPATGTLLFDPGKLEQVLVNLLDNACKFTPRKGMIEIRGYSVDAAFAEEMRSGGYRIDISDTGPGIPADRIETVFDEFTSYGGSCDRSGAGLGLAICRMIVKSHNGRIWAASGPRGAVFSLVLPYEAGNSDGHSTHQLTKALL